MNKLAYIIFLIFSLLLSCSNNEELKDNYITKIENNKEQFNEIVKYINMNYLLDSNYIKLNRLNFVLKGEKQFPKNLYFEDENLYNFMNNNNVEVISVTKFNSKCDSEFTEIQFILDSKEENDTYYEYSFCNIEMIVSNSGKLDCYKINENWLFCEEDNLKLNMLK
jgi:hypothetical protein